MTVSVSLANLLLKKERPENCYCNEDEPNSCDICRYLNGKPVKRPYVDWIKVKEILKEKGIL